MARRRSSRNPIRRAPKREFRKYIASLPTHPDSLPLTHVTDAYDLRDIVQAGRIEPQDCPIFGAPLLYLFSGRPAYRKNQNEFPNSLKAYAPIAFILDPSIGDSSSQVYPFDTGAFEASLYDDVLHTKMHVEDFALEPDPTTPGRLIALFFKTTARYFDREPDRSLTMPPSEFEASSYFELISFRGKNRRDDRASAIEVAINQPIELNHKVLAVILPYSLADDPATGKALSAKGIHLIPYKDGDGFEPSEQVPRLYDIARDFYKLKKFL